jgi:hypothetical protein
MHLSAYSRICLAEYFASNTLHFLGSRASVNLSTLPNAKDAHTFLFPNTLMDHNVQIA